MLRLRAALSAVVLCISFALISGCGAGSSPPPGFTLEALPGSVIIASGGSAQAITIGANAINGFSGSITVSITGLPTGVVATPATVSLTPGTLQQVTLSAGTGAKVATSTASIVGTVAGGSVSSSVPFSLQVTPAATTATISSTSYHFGLDLVGNPLTRSAVTVTNSGPTALTMNPVITGDAGFVIASPAVSKQCGTTLAAGATCTVRITFTPSAVSPPTVTATLDLGLGNVQPGTASEVALSGSGVTLAAGVVSPTSNPQVALYTLTLPFPGTVSVSFGPDTNYGKSTWTQSSSVAGPVSILVAGMLPLTTYHMQAEVNFTNGIVAQDSDHSFTTKAPLLQAQVAVTSTPGLTPQPGVEQLTLLNGPVSGLVVTDLAGNTLWSYVVSNPALGNQVQGAKLLPNGHFLLTLGQNSAYPFGGSSLPQGAINSAIEIDLAGNIIRQITTAELSAELTTAGYNLQLQEFHHDITELPNGHWIVLANAFKSFQDLPGAPGTTNVLGDIVVDLDTNLQPVWVWNAFDHLDVNRRPMGFPDWTHSNAIVYSPTDGNLILSMRHQNWVLKLDYRNGAGTGNIVWHLGQDGDFALMNGNAPTDWFYAQHYPSVFSTATAGKFTMGLVDNGDDREFAPGVQCGTPGAPACQYTTIPVFQIDETAMTATLLFHQVLDPSLYSAWGGSMIELANGDFEYDLAGLATGGSAIFEVTNSPTPRTVWQLNTTGSSPIYRGTRIASLYPGVQW